MAWNNIQFEFKENLTFYNVSRLSMLLMSNSANFVFVCSSYSYPKNQINYFVILWHCLQYMYNIMFQNLLKETYWLCWPQHVMPKELIFQNENWLIMCSGFFWLDLMYVTFYHLVFTHLKRRLSLKYSIAIKTYVSCISNQESY